MSRVSDGPEPPRHARIALGERLDAGILRLAGSRQRLIGLSILRIALAVAACMFYISDMGDRNLLWGPHAYDTIRDANHDLTGTLFSLYTWLGHSGAWFNALYFLGFAVAIAYGIFGTKWLTFAHALLLWSIYNRNQDILEGGDNFARIALIFLIFCTCNAYFSPLAKRTRRRLAERAEAPTQLSQAGSVLHNIGATLVVFQIVVVYTVAGYFKLIGAIWNEGTAMYYISRIHEFEMFHFYAWLFKSPLLTQGISWATIVFECAVPFVILSKRPWRREVVTFGLEGMHFGIMAFMGLVPFGLIFIGADSALLTDRDYAGLKRLLGRVRGARTSTTALRPGYAGDG